jgi:D,D-heptose 1,7-bisphosphate phosphatase
MVYHQERGIIDSPFTVEQFRLISGAGEAIRKFKEGGYKVVLVSNQPGIAKGHMSWQGFEKIRWRMLDQLSLEGVSLDGEYYCFHHPEAQVQILREVCTCRKPKPGMLFKAAKDMRLDLAQSWMVGDNLSDIKTGKNAGCRTILLGRVKCEFCQHMDEDDARPSVICPNLVEASQMIVTEAFVTK